MMKAHEDNSLQPYDHEGELYDEIGRMTEKINHMTEEIARKDAEIAYMNENRGWIWIWKMMPMIEVIVG